MKTCPQCGESDPARFTPSGTTTWCKPCGNKRRRELRAAKKLAETDPQQHDYGKHPLPAGYVVKGITQRLDSAGNVVGQYVKSQREKEAKEDQRKAMLETLCEMFEPFKGTVDPAPPPSEAESDLLLMIPIGDAHVGLRCHADETGEEFDLRIQEANHMAAVDGLLSTAPRAAEGLVVNVGDYLHADSTKGGGSTTKGTNVDTDGSRFRVLLIALRMFRRTIDAALLKCERVTVICATGNHDGESSTWLRLCLSLAYEREPRVTIKTEPRKFHFHQFGKCLFGVTHGDTCKVADLPIIMANDEPELWAATLYRLWVTGHVHHTQVKEMHGCTFRTYRTLAAQDEWHKGQGYRSGRDLRLEVWHREHGQIQEFIHGIRRSA